MTTTAELEMEHCAGWHRKVADKIRKVQKIVDFHCNTAPASDQSASVPCNTFRIRQSFPASTSFATSAS